MKLIIRGKKELLDIEEYEQRHVLDFGFFLFEFLSFDFDKFKLKKKMRATTTIETIQGFCLSAIEISELFFYLLWQEVEREYQRMGGQEEDIPVPPGIADKLNDFAWAFEEKPELDKCRPTQRNAFKEAYTAAIERFITARDIFSFACKFCLDMDFMKYSTDGFSTQQKWYILSKSAEYTEPKAFIEQYAEFTEGTSIVQPGELFYSDSLLHADTDEVYLYAGDVDGVDEPLQMPELIEKYRYAQLEPLKAYETNSLFGLLYAEFWELVTSGARVRKCALCGKYFIPFSENSEYCPRIYKDKGKSCKDYAPMVIHRRKIKQDELQFIYKKAENARYMRYKRNPELYKREKFEAWRAEAAALLERARRGELSAEEFAEEMKKK